jgi:hypothetical protein
MHHDLIGTIYSVDPTGIILEKNLFVDELPLPAMHGFEMNPGKFADGISQPLVFVTERIHHWASKHVEHKPLISPKDSQILSNRMMKSIRIRHCAKPFTINTCTQSPFPLAIIKKASSNNIKKRIFKPRNSLLRSRISQLERNCLVQ